MFCLAFLKKNKMLFPKDNFLEENQELAEYLYEFYSSKTEDVETLIKLKKNQVLFHQGVFPSCVFIVKKGILKVYTIDRNGKEYIFSLVKENNIIGYSTLMSNTSYLYSITAITNCEIVVINKDFFHSLFESDSLFLKRMNSNLIRSLIALTHNAHIIANYSVRERTALSLLNLQDFFTKLSCSNGYIELSRENHSNIVGTSVESLVRVLHDFKIENLIEVDKSKIKVLNKQGLIKASGFL